MWTVSNRTDRAYKNVDHAMVHDKGAWQFLRPYCNPHSFLRRRGQFKFDRRPSGIARLSSKKKLPKRARDVAVVWYRFYCPALLAVAVVFVEPLYTTMSLHYLSHRSPINVPLLIPHMSVPFPAHRHIVTPCNPVTPNHLL
jgi:hypothetical protein